MRFWTVSNGMKLHDSLSKWLIIEANVLNSEGQLRFGQW